MNVEKFTTEIKEYIYHHLGLSVRGDLHTLPHVHREDLWLHLQSLHNRFPENKFLRLIKKMKARRIVLDSNDRTLVFDPTFLF